MSLSKFKDMDLQWFGDRIYDDPEPDVDDRDEFDIVEVGDLNDPDPDDDEGNDDDGKVTLSSEEFQALQDKTDNAKAFKEGLSELGELLNKPAKVEDVPQQQPGESWDAFKKRFNQELFGDNPSDVLDEYLDKKLAPLMQQVGGITSEQQKKLLQVDEETGKYFKKFKKDIEEFHDSLTAQQRANPRSWQYAYDEVLKQKRDDIVEFEVQERFDEMFAKKMQEMGMDTSGQTGKAGSGKTGGVFAEGAGMSGYKTQPKSTAKKKKAKITAEEKRYCDKIGIEYEDYLLAKGRID